MVLTFESVDEILKCAHSNESYGAVLSCSAIYSAVQGGSKFRVYGRNHGQFSNGSYRAVCKYVLVMLFMMICEVILTYESRKILLIKSLCVTIQMIMSSTFLVLFLPTLYKVALAFESTNRILRE